MVLAVKPVSAVLKPPELKLFCKKLFVNVGFEAVPQQTPHADKEAPPLDVTAPPLIAEQPVDSETAVVVTVGKPIAKSACYFFSDKTQTK